MSLVRYFTKHGIVKTGDIAILCNTYGHHEQYKKHKSSDLIYAEPHGGYVTEFTVSTLLKESWCWQNPLQCFARTIFNIHPVNPDSNSFVTNRIRYIKWS